MERHLIGDIEDKFQSFAPKKSKIGIKISENFATRRDGQLLLWMTCNLICRLKGVVDELEICVPPTVQTSTPRYMPFGSSTSNLKTSLSDTLEHCTRGGSVVFAEDDLRSQLDAVISIGHETSTRIKSRFMKSVACSGWLAYIGDSEDLCDLQLSDTDNPFGAFTAACLVVGEVFKFIHGMKPECGDMIESLCFSAYDLQCHLKPWGHLENPPICNNTNLGRLYVCGAGAVAHALCQALYPIDHLQGNLIFIDRSEDPNSADETIDHTNLARYIMASNGDEGMPKAKLLANRMSKRGIQTNFFDKGFEMYVNHNNTTNFPHVVSCVDNNDARHSIQDRIPKIIHGGSISELRSQISVYDLDCNDCQCLKCYDPKEDKISDSERYGKLTKMTVAQRRVLATDADIDPEKLEQYLQNPVCGSLGNESIQKFARLDNVPEFSVNFVTALTGVLLAGEIIKNKNKLLRSVLDGSRNADMSYAFWTNSCHLAPRKPKLTCWCMSGEPTPRDIYRQIWRFL